MSIGHIHGVAMRVWNLFAATGLIGKNGLEVGEVSFIGINVFDGSNATMQTILIASSEWLVIDR